MLFRPDGSQPPTLLFRAVSVKYHYKVVVGQVSAKHDPEILKKYQIDAAKPTILYFPTGAIDEVPVKFEGEINRLEIFKFIDIQLAAKPEEKVDL